MFLSIYIDFIICPVPFHSFAQLFTSRTQVAKIVTHNNYFVNIPMKNRFNSWSAIAAEQEKTMWRNLEKTKKPKNQNFLEKFWFQVKRLFFLVFLEFFCFFLFRFLKTKKTLGFFGFLKEA